jgi:hypothetical protein
MLMSEQMRRDLDAGKDSFRATFLNPEGYSPIPHGKTGTCWKTADFAKKESADYGMWLFKPDDNENIFYCEEGDLKLSSRRPRPVEKGREQEIDMDKSSAS